jgi:hypothetical protein
MELLLADPFNDRKIKEVPRPPARPLPAKVMYPYQTYSHLPDFKAVRKHLEAHGRIGRAELSKLIIDVTHILSKYLKQVLSIIFREGT